jgi:nucleotide-binding universal stress UspA family protein
MIATNHSDLATIAVEHGLALTGSLGAGVTAVTVTPPIHTINTDAHMVEDT